MPLRKQRSVYDTIAMILSSKDGIVYQSRVIRAFGISHKDASPLLAYMESKGFIEGVDTKSLQMPYSKMLGGILEGNRQGKGISSAI